MSGTLARRVGRTVGLFVAVGAGLAGLVFILVLLGVDALESAGSALLLGWFHFAMRTAPRVAANWSAIGFALVCSALIVPLLHSFCAWLFASVRATAATSPWRLRWTLSLFAGLWLLFGFIMGATGAVHQIGWLVSSEAPLLVNRSIGQRTRFLSDTRQVELAARISEWDLAETRSLLADTDFRLLERYHLLLFPDAQGKVAGILVFPRSAADREKLGIFAFDRSAEGEDDGNSKRGDFHDARELASWIARFGNLSNQEPAQGER